MIPCATDRDSLVSAAWAAANLHANAQPGSKALDRNGQHTVAGLSVRLAMGTLPSEQATRLLAYWAWWDAVWSHYEAVLARIAEGEAASFDPSVPGRCPWNIWELARPADPVRPAAPAG